jgi:Kdo2-lipid IVA lauroyltransferase/acyltransferase
MEADIPSEQFLRIRQLVFDRPEARTRFARWLVTIQQQNHPAAVELVRTNLAICFPQLSVGQIEGLVEKNLLHYFDAKLENAGFSDASDEEVRERVSFGNLELLSAQRGKPVIIVCPHFISFTAICHRLALETPLVALYGGDSMGKVLKAVPRFNKHMLLPSDANGIRTAIRQLQQGNTVFVMPDLHPHQGVGVKVSHFSRPTKASPLVGELQKFSNATVLGLIATNLGGGRHHGEFCEPVRAPYAHLSVSDWCTTLAQFFEQEIRKRPAQYWWGHPRFAAVGADERSPYSSVVDLHVSMLFGVFKAQSQVAVAPLF